MNFCELPKPEAFNQLKQCQIEELDKCINLTQKILNLTNLLELREQDYYERKTVQQNLLSQLKVFYPNCELYVFGSSINGLGCQGCDLDLLFLPFPEYSNEDFQNAEEEPILNPAIVQKSASLKQKLLSMNDVCHLKFIQKILFTKPHMFAKVFFIPAKCPILNIKLTEFGFECDLSASNKLVVCNSELIKLYGSLDPRVRPIIFLLRYWAKSLGLVQKSLLSSYAFCFMVIFALQNTDPPILPSVQYLNSRAGYSYKINGWETAFLPNDGKIPKTENTANIMELLIHFFDFYWNFDFTQNIVSPYSGKPWPIEELKMSPNEKLRNFPVSTFSVQDPFILNRNISRNATMKTAFKLTLLVAKDLIKNDKFYFKLFFKPDYFQKQINSWHASSYDMYYTSKESELFTLKFTYDYVAKARLTQKSWIMPVYGKIAHVIYDILQYGLLMECEIIDEVFFPKSPPKRKRKKCAPLSSHPKLVISIQCIAYYDTWNSRKTITETDSANEIKNSLCDTLKKEHAISRKLVGVPSEIHNTPILCFQCNCFKYSEANVSDLIVVLRPLTNNMQIYGLGKFLRSFIPRTVEKIFNEM